MALSLCWSTHLGTPGTKGTPEGGRPAILPIDSETMWIWHQGIETKLHPSSHMGEAGKKWRKNISVSVHDITLWYKKTRKNLVKSHILDNKKHWRYNETFFSKYRRKKEKMLHQYFFYLKFTRIRPIWSEYRHNEPHTSCLMPRIFNPF